MPSIDTSVTPNVIQDYNKSNAKPDVQTNNSFKTIIHLQNTTQSPYRTYAAYTTSPPPSKRLSTVAIVFIVFGVITAFIVLCALFYYLWRRWKRSKPPPPITTPKPLVPPITPAIARAKPPAKPVAQPRPTPHHLPPRHAPSPAPPSRPPMVLSSLHCRQPLCREYLTRLNLPEAYFAKTYDKCFCRKCHDSSNTDGNCGSWCTPLHNWIRFGLRVNEAHKKRWNIFKEWKTSYYGTSPNRLSSILSSRFVPLDNDTLADGTTFKSGHPDPDSCITSPSLAYASQRQFTASLRFRAIDTNDYYVQVVLQCKQKPDAINSRTDPKSGNIEWTTKARSSVVPIGLLVRLQKA